MRNKIILNILLVLTIATLLFAMPAKVFAEAVDFNDPNFWEDQGGLDNIEDEEQTPTPETPAPETQKPEETLPHAGVAEDTIMVISIIALGAMATFAYKKVNEYNNI